MSEKKLLYYQKIPIGADSVKMQKIRKLSEVIRTKKKETSKSLL